LIPLHQLLLSLQELIKRFRSFRGFLGGAHKTAE